MDTLRGSFFLLSGSFLWVVPCLCSGPRCEFKKWQIAQLFSRKKRDGECRSGPRQLCVPGETSRLAAPTLARQPTCTSRCVPALRPPTPHTQCRCAPPACARGMPFWHTRGHLASHSDFSRPNHVHPAHPHHKCSAHAEFIHAVLFLYRDLAAPSADAQSAENPGGGL